MLNSRNRSRLLKCFRDGTFFNFEGDTLSGNTLKKLKIWHPYQPTFRLYLHYTFFGENGSGVKWSHLGQILNFKKIDLGQLLSNK